MHCSDPTLKWNIFAARIGLEIHQRLASALDPNGEPEVLEALEMLYAGGASAGRDRLRNLRANRWTPRGLSSTDPGEIMTEALIDPVVFNPYDYHFHDDPYPTYKRLREESPLYHNPDVGFWALSRYADVVDGFKDNKRLSSANGVSLDPAAYGPHAHYVMSFLAMDDPRHMRLRQLVSRGFTPRRVAELDGRILELTKQHLIPALGAGEFDWITEVAGKLPMDVISELMGVPEPDRAELRRKADLVVHREAGVLDVPQPAVEASISLMGYYKEMIAQRRRSRTDDLTSALLDAEIDGDKLSDQEILGFMFLMVVAGNETTTKLLGNALYWGFAPPGADRTGPRTIPNEPRNGWKRLFATTRRARSWLGLRLSTSNTTGARFRRGRRSCS